MTMALHVSTDHRAIEDIECGKVCRHPMPLVVMGHGSKAALLEWQSRLGAVKCLYLGLFIKRKHDSMSRRINIEPDNIAQLVKLRTYYWSVCAANKNHPKFKLYIYT
jgi:hypothetical protein